MSTHREIIEELLRQGTPVTFQAGGPSMTPTIRDGDSVQVHPLRAPMIQRGSIVLYKMNGRLVLHRFILHQKQTNRIWVTGDAAMAGGDWISRKDLLGIALCVERRGRIHRLDTRFSRAAGRIRYAMRPLRRLLSHVRLKTHPHTSTPHS